MAVWLPCTWLRMMDDDGLYQNHTALFLSPLFSPFSFPMVSLFFHLSRRFLSEILQFKSMQKRYDRRNKFKELSTVRCNFREGRDKNDLQNTFS